MSDDADGDDSDVSTDQDTSDSDEESSINESTDSSDDEISIKKSKMSVSASTGIPLVLFNSYTNCYETSRKLKWRKLNNTFQTFPDGPSSQQNKDNDEEDSVNSDSDEVVKAILDAKKLHRNHPPSITLEDMITDICFHPKMDIIGVASITGDIFL